ncbi:MAG: hypothetical protein WAQ98_14700 [Blastocatellia bacterium]
MEETRNFYDKIQVWHLIAVIVFVFFLFFSIIKITQVRPFEPYQEKVVDKIVSDYEKVITAKRQELDVFLVTVRFFSTDPSWQNWTKEKASKELVQILENLSSAELHMDKLKSLSEKAILKIEQGERIPDSLLDSLNLEINEIKTCVNNVKTLSR